MLEDQEEVKVTIFIPDHHIEGIIHLFKGGRLSDFLNATTKGFIPINNATIYTKQDNKVIGKPKFMGLNRNSIIMLYKTDENAE